MKYLVIDVGGTYTKYAVVTEKCEFLEKGKIPSVIGPLDKFLESITQIYINYKEQVSGIALSMPGIIDSKNGFMYTGGSIDCIENINIVKSLEELCLVPISVENDAKCAALAEVWKGSLKECNNAVVVVCGTGIGGAIIMNHEVVHGTHHMAGEFSYQMTYNKQPYNEEELFGISAGIGFLLRLASEKMKIDEKEINGEIIFEKANEGNEAAISAIREYARRVALQISNYQFIIDPEKIAVGGGISAQPLFFEILQEELEKISKIYEKWKCFKPKVVNCKYFNDSNLIGALYVHLRQREQINKIDA